MCGLIEFKVYVDDEIKGKILGPWDLFSSSYVCFCIFEYQQMFLICLIIIRYYVYKWKMKECSNFIDFQAWFGKYKKDESMLWYFKKKVNNSFLFIIAQLAYLILSMQLQEVLTLIICVQIYIADLILNVWYN